MEAKQMTQYNKPPCIYCKSDEHSSYDSAIGIFDCSDKMDISIELNDFLMQFRTPDTKKKEKNVSQPA